jgi:hypothetical protein
LRSINVTSLISSLPPSLPQVLIHNEGKLTIVSGSLTLSSALITVGMGTVEVGMAAELVLAGASTHVIGGIETGVERLSDSPGRCCLEI